jgi:hypothetical protein
VEIGNEEIRVILNSQLIITNLYFFAHRPRVAVALAEAQALAKVR